MITSFHNKLCVITGGSSGIGLAIAERLAREQAQLLLVARGEAALEAAAERLRALGATQVQTLVADVASDPEMQKLAPAIAAMGVAADLVVNSAGIVSGGLLCDVPMDEWRRLHEINVLGLLRVLQATLPAMQARAERGDGGGHLVNIASAAGLLGFPGLAAYGATKSAVITLGESLRLELAASGIGVTTVCPGFVQTPIAGKFRLFGRMDNERTRRFVSDWFVRNRLSADTVAERALAAVRRNRRLVVVGRDAVSGYWSKRLVPGLLERMLRRRVPSTRKRAAA